MSKKAGFDAFADIYDASYQAPVRQYVEAFTFKNLIGEVGGLSVLDVACGDGKYTRMLKQAGAAKVVGVDIAEKMIDVAHAKEQQNPLGLTYMVADAADIAHLGVFDVLSAVYLLHYSPTREHLGTVCRALFANLVHGGRLVTLVANPTFPQPGRSDYSTYGFKSELSDHDSDGAPLTMKVLMGAIELATTLYRWRRETYESALREAGFSDIVWYDAMLDPEGQAKLGDDFWQGYMSNPHLAALTCVK